MVRLTQAHRISALYLEIPFFAHALLILLIENSVHNVVAGRATQLVIIFACLAGRVAICHFCDTQPISNDLN